MEYPNSHKIIFVLYWLPYQKKTHSTTAHQHRSRDGQMQAAAPPGTRRAHGGAPPRTPHYLTQCGGRTDTIHRLSGGSEWETTATPRPRCRYTLMGIFGGYPSRCGSGGGGGSATPRVMA